MKLKVYTKRTLSLILCVVMLLSCWVFTAPNAVAADATAGSYYVEIDVHIASKADYNQKYVGPYFFDNDGWSGNPGCKDMAGITLFYKDDNGTKEEKADNANVGTNVTTAINQTVFDHEKFKSFGLGNNDTVTYKNSDGNLATMSNVAGTKNRSVTLVATDIGFPTSFAVYANNDSWNEWGEWEITAVRVGTSATNCQTIWDGSCYVANSNGTEPARYKVNMDGTASVWNPSTLPSRVKSSGFGGATTWIYCKHYNGGNALGTLQELSDSQTGDTYNQASNATINNTTQYRRAWAAPQPSFTDFSYTKEYTDGGENDFYYAPETAPLASSPFVTVDQYGVQLAGTLTNGFDLTEVGISGTTTAASVAADGTITPQKANGTQNHAFKTTPKTLWKIGGNAVNVNGVTDGTYYGSSSKNVYFNYPEKTVTYGYNTTTTLAAPVETDAENHIYDSMSTPGTATAGTASAFYGDTITAAAPTGNYNYYDVSGHYAGTTFTAPTAAMTADVNVGCDYSAPTAHNWVGDAEHDWEEITSENITENMSGDTYHRQTCNVNGETHYHYQPHTWDEGVDNPAATCTEAGNITYTCTGCGKTKDVAKSATGHTSGTPVKENEVAANCESIGGYDMVTYCTVCNAVLSSEHTTIRATGHNTDGAAWQTDGTNHWKVCQNANCPNPTQEQSGHTFTGEAEVTKAATCTETGTETKYCSVCSHEVEQEIPIDSTNHDPVLHKAQAPTDDSPGVVYFECSRGCETFFPAVDNNGQYVAGAATKKESTAIENSDSIPAPKFNSFSDGDIGYDYATRGASLKLAKETENGDTIQKMRFSGSVVVPNGLSTTIDAANLAKYNAGNLDAIDDNSVIDFGFVYTQHQFVISDDPDAASYYSPDPNKLDHWGSDNLYRMSVAANNAGKQALDTTEETNSWTGVTVHQSKEDGSQTLTFNLLLNVKQKNWKTLYIARTYIIYKYHGEVYTVFDGYKDQTGVSDRAVWYVAAQLYAAHKGTSLGNYLTDYILNEASEDAIPNTRCIDWYKFPNEDGVVKDKEPTLKELGVL